MSNTERRDRIIRILKMNKTVSTAYLANRLSVSTRTISRDIVELSIRYPITTQPGRHGGITIVDPSVLPRTVLPESEINLLKKVFEEAEAGREITISPEDLLLLKEMIATYKK